MLAYQYYVDDIQGAVCAPETADPEFLRDAAAQYAEACAEANRRLRQVSQLLRKGLRSEAIQLTEEDPNLLDFVGMLDFPELSGWGALLKRWGMAPPPALLIDLAADINQAYAEHQPLESMLKQHRLLAMGRAPLAARIRNLRQIRRVDTLNVAWEEDLKNLESARIKQIDREIDLAHRRDDLTALAGIKSELDDDWLINRPQYLHNKANVAFGELSTRTARAELSRLEQDLNTAHLALDVKSALELRERWTTAAAAAALQPSDPLARRVSPVLDWLIEEDRRNTTQNERNRLIEELVEAVSFNALIPKLARLYKSVSLFDEPIPLALKQQVEERLAAHAEVVKRRRSVKWVTAVAIVVLAIGSFAYLFAQQRKWSKYTSVANTLNSMIDNNQLNEAQTFYDQSALSMPEIISEDRIQTQKRRLGETLKAEQMHHEMFAGALARADVVSEGINRDALAEAHKLAQTIDEKKGVADIEEKLARLEHRVQEEQDEALREKLTGLQTRIQEIQLRGSPGSKAILVDLSVLSTDIEGAKRRFAKATATTLTSLEALASQVKSIRQSIDSENQQSVAKAGITHSIGQPEAFDAALTEFAKQFPDSEISSNLSLLKNESKLWQGFSQWANFESEVFSNNQVITSKTARDFLTAGEKLDRAYAGLQLGERFKASSRYLESVAAREPENDTPLISEVQKLCRDPLVGNLWMVESNHNNGARYYCKHEPNRKDESLLFSYVAGFNLEEKPQSIREADAAYVGKAPQSILAEQVAELLSGMSPRDWEKNFTTILSSITKEDRLDPILKIALLQKVIKTAAAGSSALGDGFAEFRHQLDNHKIDLSVSWMDPRNSTGQAERKRADVFLSGLPPIADSIRATALNLKLVREPPDSKYEWIGWISPGPENSWNLEKIGRKLEDGELVIISKMSKNERCEPVTIGTVEKDGVHFRSAGSSNLLAGRPVFLRVQIRTSK